MRYVTISLASVLLMTTSFAQAQDICQKAYKANIQNCVTQLQSLAPSMRSMAQAACVAQAQADRQACEAPNTCSGQCDMLYSEGNNTCDEKFDPNRCASGDKTCQQTQTANRAACLDSNLAAFNACLAPCTGTNP
jgi:hypothetical protein